MHPCWVRTTELEADFGLLVSQARLLVDHQHRPPTPVFALLAKERAARDVGCHRGGVRVVVGESGEHQSQPSIEL